jgi:hypothetical protein
MLALLGATVVAFVAVGWYLNWYHVQATPGAPAGHQNVTVDIDSAKILQDGQKGVRKIEDKLQKGLEHKTLNETKAADTGKPADGPAGEPPLDPPGQ